MTSRAAPLSPLRLCDEIRQVVLASPTDQSAAILEGLANWFLLQFGRGPYLIPSPKQLGSHYGSGGGQLARDLIASNQTMGRRMVDLLIDLFDALNRRRLVNAALVGRALLECGALCVYTYEKLLEFTKQGERASHSEMAALVQRLTWGGRFDWGRLRAPSLLREYAMAKSTQDEPQPPASARAVNVVTLLRVLDAAVGRKMPPVKGTHGVGVVRAVYAALSDFCHPAVGGLRLYLRPRSEPDSFSATSIMGDEQLKEVWTWMSAVPPVLVCVRDALNSMLVFPASVKHP